ncbi:MAG: hypothetical protein HWE20_12840 [Gammaproteobacteria bacterium]|nr:hypothetical protein [Gammaproteobacteria bacterium]
MPHNKGRQHRPSGWTSYRTPLLRALYVVRNMISSEEFENLKRMPDEYASIDYDRVFTLDEYERLRNGLYARSMNEKWYARFYDNSFYMFRSWSGNCIFEFDLKEVGKGYRVVSARANRNREQYNADDDAYDVLFLDFLVSNLILGESKPYPSRNSSPLPKGLEQHVASGTSYQEVKTTKKAW